MTVNNYSKSKLNAQNCSSNKVVDVNSTISEASAAEDASKGCCKLREKILRRGRTGRGSSSSRSNKKNGNALKFHNFIANQNSPSTCVAETHCLREEHGTKQITVSHWRKPIIHEDSSSSEEEQLQPLDALRPALCSQLETQQQQSILESLLAKEDCEKTSDNCNRKVNKRKPLMVRRVLRKEESDEQQEPLDLSVKKRLKHDSHRFEQKAYEHAATQMSSADLHGDSIHNLIRKVEQSAAEAASIIASVSGTNSTSGTNCSQVSNLCPIAVHQIVRPMQANSHYQQAHYPCVNANIDSVNNTPSFAPSLTQSQQKQLKQRNTQRGAIKQKLEDAFRQNGFLVKTKQVSDGEATFCKFRQLRKYTRYYLKSWHQHLPDEVNKLWKGFLPPKTAKPASSQN
ncbi:hypothetical protein B4U79_01546 [Dinothrombium tinctorium]|uniref:Uncharacterized protein n=1 Tax=Dinothrombium tinctorium TaxID=1965070 RepID=A0A3S3Q687_9ACAR|nr:hypothetical protein B4U79_13795 [Dinothrombium tinctorium]RWS14717.1 hypothetical protein B4U79_09954 [Dinothrombium tinctorium]RWS14718.1 hypothetical protein B4U79_01546 [Dinothrombium tinctorium]